MHIRLRTPKRAPTRPRGTARFIRWWTRRRTRQKALERAYLEYRATHKHLHELRFDWHFLTGRGAEALAARDAEVLARAWTTQFRYCDEARRAADIRQLLPVAETLLELLDAEGWFSPDRRTSQDRF